MRHLTWSDEATNGECPKCGTKTVLVVADSLWLIKEDYDEYADIEEEITGHWCPECKRLRSLSLNTIEQAASVRETEGT